VSGSEGANDLWALREPEGRAWAAFLRGSVSVLAQMNEELETGAGMPLTQYDVLRQLALAPGQALRMSDLAERVMLSRPGLTGVVKRLEAQGLVVREPSPEDGRGLHAVLTPEGRRRLHEVHPTHVRSIRERFAGHFTDEELGTLAALLGRLGPRLRQPPSAGDDRPATPPPSLPLPSPGTSTSRSS